MATFKIEATPDDLLLLIGIMSIGQDPIQSLGPSQVAEFTDLGRQFAETVLVRRKNDEVTASLAATQQRMVSALQVVSDAPPEAPVPLRPTADDIQMADTGG